MKLLARWIIIDGNNLLHADPCRRPLVLNDFSLARNDLVRQMETLLGVLAERITIVFDGTIGGRQTGFEAARVEVLFSSENASADAIIERIATDHGAQGTTLVISSDRQERQTVEAAGIRTLSCNFFLQEIERMTRNLRAEIKRKTISPKPQGKLGDFFPSNREK